MIFTLIFSLILSIFGSVVSIVVPLLPESVNTIMAFVFDKIGTGLNYVWLFVPKNLIMQLFNWWIVLCGLLLTVELFIEIWRLITGNIGGQDVEAESVNTITYTDNHGNSHTVERVTNRVTSSKFKNKYPKF